MEEEGKAATSSLARARVCDALLTAALVGAGRALCRLVRIKSPSSENQCTDKAHCAHCRFARDVLCQESFVRVAMYGRGGRDTLVIARNAMRLHSLTGWTVLCDKNVPKRGTMQHRPCASPQFTISSANHLFCRATTPAPCCTNSRRRSRMHPARIGRDVWTCCICVVRGVGHARPVHGRPTGASHRVDLWRVRPCSPMMCFLMAQKKKTRNQAPAGASSTLETTKRKTWVL